MPLLVLDDLGVEKSSDWVQEKLDTIVDYRYFRGLPLVVTTNKAFADWGEIFPNAACVVSLIDRLMHRAEVVRIDGDSYRAKEAEEREAQRKVERAANAAAPRPRRAAR